ncbi:hypothetical protein HZL39_14470 (plasmid) [Lactiplantibacillus plantarum]|uniref:hypothetical protein n=1 Tax=Lactiplantibacillus plantarum TaxID=1590 RepID=UPI001F1B330F|nr:hypothetical protein [Lactiplantibacillus plantarum]MCG0724129.1 hypothetical protein [Lactiplantibacillus plantarum]UJL26248.1 hypothetical protein HZL39_14470 [Lactiplantibacillus plantarum]
MLVIDELKARVSESPDKNCILSPEENFTFREVDMYSNMIAKEIASMSSKEIVPLW